MKKILLQSLVVGCVLSPLSGCNNIGNAPTGASPDQIKADVAKQDPLQQIRTIMYEPQMPAMKESRIKAIEDKYHVSRADAMKNLPTPTFSHQAPPEVPTGGAKSK